MSNLIHWRISETQIGGFNLQAPEQNTWSNHRVHCSMDTTCGFHLSQTLKNNGCVTYDGDTSYMSRIGYNMIQPVKGNDQKKSTTARKWEIIPILVGIFGWSKNMKVENCFSTNIYCGIHPIPLPSPSHHRLNYWVSDVATATSSI